MEQQTITPENPGEIVSRRVERLSGRPLSWATAIAVGAGDIQVINKEITANYFGTLYVGAWDPVHDWEQCGRILDHFGIEFKNDGALSSLFHGRLPDERINVWARTMKTTNVDGRHTHTVELEDRWFAGSNRRLAACRAVVAKAEPMGDILIPTRLLYG